MSTTIDSLSIQIETQAGAATQNIDALSTALGKLKQNSSLTKVTNNLNKLATALNGVTCATSNLSGLTQLGTALNGLANIPKLTGLSSALNTLRRLPEIINSLSSANLDLFTVQMQRLATALGPVATQISAVSAGFASLPAHVSNAANATHNMNGQLNTTQLNFMAIAANIGTLMGAVNHVIQVISTFLAQAIEWDGIQFRFGRAFGEDAEEVYQYVLKINDVIGINIQEFMQYSSLYGSLLSGFGMAQKKVTAISVGLTELSYDIWAAYNDRFKTLEQASEAVRSAITGEIEPIRNAGIALTEASLQEFINSTHLAGVSIEKLTEAQKAEVRYAAMVDAAMNQGIIGTYAREMNTAEGAVRSLSQSFKSLTQALGSLFIPMLQVVVPYVTAFVEIITDAVFWLAELFNIPIQKINWDSATKGASDTATGLSNAADAAKKLKNYTMGFDELNVIDPNSGSSGGAGGAGNGWGEGLDLESIWDDAVFAQASKRVDEIKAKVLGFMEDWGWAIAAVGAGIAGFAVFKHWGTIVEWGSKIVGWFSRMNGFVRLVVEAFKDFGGVAGTALAEVSPTLSRVVGFLSALTGPQIAIIAAVIAAIASTVYFLYKNWDEVVRAVKDFFAENIAPKLEEIKGHFDAIVDALGPFGEKIKEFVEKIDMSWLAKTFEVIGGVIFSVIGGVIMTAFNILVGMVENVIQIITGLVEIISGMVKIVVGIFKGDFQLILDAVQLVVDGVNNFFMGMAEFVVDIVIDFVEGIIGWFTELWDELVGHSIVPDTVNGIIDWFLSLPKKILGPIGKFVEGVLQKFKDLWSDIKTWYSSNVAPKFTKEYWVTKFDGLKSGFTQTIKNMLNAGIDLINKFIGWINTKLNFSWDALEIAGKEVFPGGSVQLFTIPTIQKLETGGFLEDGLFTMNYGEIAGKFNNGRSVVANNEQIISGIAEGVYSAVVSAMTETQRGSNEQNVNVYLDGKQIYASVKRTEGQRGASLMGNQLGYLY